MEKLLFGVVITMSVVSPALAGGAAQAHYRHHYYYNYSEALPRYESCNCWFGYDGNVQIPVHRGQRSCDCGQFLKIV
jgi:hypothetical protein